MCVKVADACMDWHYAAESVLVVGELVSCVMSCRVQWWVYWWLVGVVLADKVY